MSLSEEAITLQRAAHDLMYLGIDGSPIYSDDLSRRNGEVYRLTTTLYNSDTKDSTVTQPHSSTMVKSRNMSKRF